MGKPICFKDVHRYFGELRSNFTICSDVDLDLATPYKERTVDERRPWNQGWDISEESRAVYRSRSHASRIRKEQALRGEGPEPLHSVNVPRLHPEDLMPMRDPNGIQTLSLFSGCGGLDLGFDRAGFDHVASYDHYEPAAETLRMVRPSWTVFGGQAGDVQCINWKPYRGKVALLHGGCPCQPFSVSGRQLGKRDPRDMFPEFVRAVLEVQPEVFVAENVPALGSEKFKSYVRSTIIAPLSLKYTIITFELRAANFGVPQTRRRIIFVGFRSKSSAKAFRPPQPTHSYAHLTIPRAGSTLSLLPDMSADLERCMGTREALGLPDIGFDALAPTLRSSLTGPRHTTSIVSSVSAHRLWERLEIWPNGVAPTRDDARIFVARNGHFRMAVPDCAVLQGFPDSWPIGGSVYVALGQIGNAVAPPMGYHLASAIAKALGADRPRQSQARR